MTVSTGTVAAGITAVKKMVDELRKMTAWDVAPRYVILDETGSEVAWRPWREDEAWSEAVDVAARDHPEFFPEPGVPTVHALKKNSGWKSRRIDPLQIRAAEMLLALSGEVEMLRSAISATAAAVSGSVPKCP